VAGRRICHPPKGTKGVSTAGARGRGSSGNTRAATLPLKLLEKARRGVGAVPRRNREVRTMTEEGVTPVTPPRKGKAGGGETAWDTSIPAASCLTPEGTRCVFSAVRLGPLAEPFVARLRGTSNPT